MYWEGAAALAGAAAALEQAPLALRMAEGHLAAVAPVQALAAVDPMAVAEAMAAARPLGEEAALAGS